MIPNQKTKREQAIEYLTLLLRGIVKYPDELTIQDKLDIRGLLLNINGNPADLPLLIGRGGETANALRKIMRMWGYRNVATVSLIFGKSYSDNHPNA